VAAGVTGGESIDGRQIDEIEQVARRGSRHDGRFAE
jgi:hypothetical protein